MDFAGVLAGVGHEEEEEEEEAPFPPPMAGPLLEPPRGAARGAEAAQAEGAEANHGPDPGIPPDPDDEDDEDEDEDDDDDDDGPPNARTDRFREAVSLLERADGPIHQLTVRGGVPAAADDGSSFPRFVALLGGEGGGRTVQRLEMTGDWRGLRDRDMKRRFRDVLPGHPTLKCVAIDIGQGLAGFVRGLTENLPTAEGSLGSVLCLRVGRAPDCDPAIQAKVVQAIANMLNRNAAITHLQVNLSLDANQCKLICQALHRNTNLVALYLRAEEVFADTLDGVGTSSLKCLCVHGSFSEGAVSSLAWQLRTNDTLQILELLTVGFPDDNDRQALLDLMSTYNHTIHLLYYALFIVAEPLRERMIRTPCFRAALQWLLLRPDLNRGPGRLLPRLLGTVSEHPTALYRVLKIGYVNEVGDLLAAAAHADRRRRRRRRRRLSWYLLTGSCLTAVLVAAFGVAAASYLSPDAST